MAPPPLVALLCQIHPDDVPTGHLDATFWKQELETNLLMVELLSTTSFGFGPSVKGRMDSGACM